MNQIKIFRAEELPFTVTTNLAESINRLVDAIESEEDDPLYDCYLCDVAASARDVSEENDAWIREYYVRGGWKKGR